MFRNFDRVLVIRRTLALLFVPLAAFAALEPSYGGEVTGSSAPDLPIDDVTPLVVDTITIPAVDSLVIADARVDIDITHTFRGDLTVNLTTTTGGTDVVVCTGAGFSADDIAITFASVGAPFDPTNLTAGVGFAMEAQGPGAMSDFHGADSADDWKLTVSDAFPMSDFGSLNAWGLRLSSQPAGPPPPANDGCAQAIELFDGDLFTRDSTGATESEVVGSCQSGTALDTWFVYTAGCDGDVVFSLNNPGTQFDTTLSIYDGTGGCPTDGTAEVACNDDAVGTASEIVLAATANTTYYIQIAGASGATGPYEISVENDALPSNDRCNGALDIGDVVDLPFTNGCATPSGANPGCATTAVLPIDLWYRYTAGCDGDVTIDTFGSELDTQVAVWDACGGAVLDCNDDAAGGLQSQLVVSGVSSGETILIQVAGFASSQGTGDLTVSCGLPEGSPITDLECNPADGQVTLAWMNGAAYDSIEIVVEGTVSEVLPGDATGVTLTGLVGFSTLVVCVRTILVGTVPAETCCEFTIPGNVDGQIVIVDGDLGGNHDSAEAIESALLTAGETPIMVGSPLDYFGTPTELFVCLGTFPARSVLSTDEGQRIFDTQAAGVPVFLSSGDTWGFDPVTPFNQGDGIDNESALDGDDTFEGGIGAGAFAGLDFSYTQDQATDDFTDQIDPVTAGSATADAYGTNASTAWSDDGAGGSAAPYDTGVFYDTGSGVGNSLCISWEFGGYDGDHDVLLEAIRTALEETIVSPDPQFNRGDTNGDGGFDIADMVNLLTFLFPAGSPFDLLCDDAADTNDDGMLNIADAINGLGVLFPGGTPAVVPAPFGSCGTDPTADSLDCASFPPCP